MPSDKSKAYPERLSFFQKENRICSEEEVVSLRKKATSLDAWRDLALQQAGITALGRIKDLFPGRAALFGLFISGKTEARVVIKQELCADYDFWRNYLRVGDIIAIEGLCEQSRQGDRAEIQVKSIFMITPCLLGKNDVGFTEKGMFTGNKARRYFHSFLCSNTEEVIRLEMRAEMFRLVRAFLQENGFQEHDTPIITHSFFGGGSKPFITHLVDNNTEVYLRMVSEIALKTYIAGGLERVYEIGHSFRNSSGDATHPVPFMLLEAYAAYMGYEEVKELSKGLYMYVVDGLRKYISNTKLSFDEATFPAFNI